MLKKDCKIIKWSFFFCYLPCPKRRHLDFTLRFPIKKKQLEKRANQNTQGFNIFLCNQRKEQSTVFKKKKFLISLLLINLYVDAVFFGRNDFSSWIN